LPLFAPRPVHCDESVQGFVHHRPPHDSPGLHCTLASAQGSPVPSCAQTGHLRRRHDWSESKSDAPCG